MFNEIYNHHTFLYKKKKRINYTVKINKERLESHFHASQKTNIRKF